MENITGWEQKLIGRWEIDAGWRYGAWVIGLALLIRFAACALRAMEPAPPSFPRAFLRRLGRYFRGFYAADDPSGGDYWYPDYWHPTILGTLELIGYPVLMAVGAWSAIGAWLAFKALAQWENWKTSRPAYNRFLIGNALAVMLAFWLLVPMIHVKP
jgi:hypothetical protein